VSEKSFQEISKKIKMFLENSVYGDTMGTEPGKSPGRHWNVTQRFEGEGFHENHSHTGL
jgi:hypothetical protein